MGSIYKHIRINERINVPEVRVIGPNSEQIGVVPIRRAVELAREHELDLVEVSPTSNPPVCRIIDYSKYKYDQEKKERRVKRSQHVTQLKQIRFKPHIDENDYQIKVKQAAGFLSKKDKVKVNMFFRGRELSFKDHGEKILTRVVADLAEHGVPEKSPIFEGRVMSIVIAPRSTK